MGRVGSHELQAVVRRERVVGVGPLDGTGLIEAPVLYVGREFFEGPKLSEDHSTGLVGLLVRSGRDGLYELIRRRLRAGIPPLVLASSPAPSASGVGEGREQEKGQQNDEWGQTVHGGSGSRAQGIDTQLAFSSTAQTRFRAP